MISLGEGLADLVTVGVMDGLDSLWDEQAVSTKRMVRATALNCLRTWSFKHVNMAVSMRALMGELIGSIRSWTLLPSRGN